MGWCTTLDLDEFVTEAGGYLRARAAENTLLLSAVQAARAGRPPRGTAGPGATLYGWWQPPDGGGPRGAFVHDPARPLLISGRVPEMATTLAAALARTGRQVSGVDASTEAADAFAAAWSQRAGAAVRVQRQCRVYRITHRPSRPAGGSWPPPEAPHPVGWLRVAGAADQHLLADWLAACAAEAAERIDSAPALAADLIGYGGAIFWEVPQWGPVSVVTLTRPVLGTTRISRHYTPPEHRRNNYSAMLTTLCSYAVLEGTLPGAPGPVAEVVLISDGNRPDRSGGLFGYQLVDERAVLRFGPVTGSLPQAPRTGPAPRLPTGPLPRIPRLRR